MQQMLPNSNPFMVMKLISSACKEFWSHCILIEKTLIKDLLFHLAKSPKMKNTLETIQENLRSLMNLTLKNQTDNISSRTMHATNDWDASSYITNDPNPQTALNPGPLRCLRRNSHNTRHIVRVLLSYGQFSHYGCIQNSIVSPYVRITEPCTVYQVPQTKHESYVCWLLQWLEFDFDAAHRAAIIHETTKAHFNYWEQNATIHN